MSRRPVLVGASDYPLTGGRFDPPVSVLGAQAVAAVAALDEAGIPMNAVDGLLTAGVWAPDGVGRLPSVTMAEYLGLQPRYSDTTNTGGASFETHVAHASRALTAGDCEVALITYGSRQKSDRSRSLTPRPALLSMQHESPYGILTPIGVYALAAMRHMHQYGTTSADLAEIAVATRAWAVLNPAATMREPITVDDVLASPMISDPLHLLDSCLVTDGAGAVVLTTEEHARAIGAGMVYIQGFASSESHWTIASMPDLTVTPAAHSGPAAMAMAGIGVDDVDVALLYDSFTITVLLTLESLGFCAPGEGAAFVRGQRTAPGGDFPLNTNGGGLSCGHPGMYGIFLLVEAFRQLRGIAGDRQVPDARVALVSGTGGSLSSAATCVLSAS